MYINLKLLEELNLTPQSVAAMQIIAQNRTEEINDKTISSVLPDIPKEYLTSIKGTKSSSDLSKLRLTSEANKILRDIAISDVEKDDIELIDYMIPIYLSYNDNPNIKEENKRKIGSKKKLVQEAATLRCNMGLSRKEFFFLMLDYLEKNEDSKYTKILQYVVYKSEDRYAKLENNIETSRLYQHYQNNKEEIDLICKQKIKN